MKPRGLQGMLFLFSVLVAVIFPLRGAVAHEALERHHDELTVFEQAPFVLEGHTYVPVRELAGQLEIALRWDGEENKLIFDNGQHAFGFERLSDQPGRGIVTNLGSELDHHAMNRETEGIWPYHLERGRLFLPLRQLAQFFEWNIAWEPDRKEISLAANSFNGKPFSLSFIVDEPYSRQLWPTPQRIAYLTFDDGPSQKVTPLILDILSKENIKATFFVVGEQVKKNPEILKRIYEEGHTIGNHTYSHQPAVIFSGTGPLMQEIRKSEELIYATIGERTTIFRMPYGTNFSQWPAYRRALEQSGYSHVSWNVNSMDSTAKNVPAGRIVNSVKRQVTGKDKVIILFHDLVSTTTAEALPDIIQYLKGQGYFIWPI